MALPIAIDQTTDDKATAKYDAEVTAQATYAGKNSGYYEQKWPEITAGVTHQTHVYDGPIGKGFIVMSTYNDGTADYTKAKGYGPESRDQDWTKIVDIEI